MSRSTKKGPVRIDEKLWKKVEKLDNAGKKRSHQDLGPRLHHHAQSLLATPSTSTTVGRT